MLVAEAAKAQEIEKKIKFLPPVLDAVAVDICELYPRRQGSIWKRPGQKRWMQWSAELVDMQILGVMSDEGRGLLRGCYWGETTRHGVIDVDINSKYHNPQELGVLVDKLALVGIKLVPYQSSESGGWHLYYFLEDFELTEEVEKLVKTWLKTCGYEIKSGTLEVFPSGNALRLPLQAGFAWLGLDGEIEVKREKVTQDQAIALFLKDLEENKTNWSEAKALILEGITTSKALASVEVKTCAEKLQDKDLVPAKESSESSQKHEDAISSQGFEKLFWKGIDWDKYHRGRQYWIHGLTEKSQRHDAIHCIGHYLWYGDEGAGLSPLPFFRNRTRRAELISKWILRKHNGLSEEINSGRLSEVEGDIERAASWTKERSMVNEYKNEYEPYMLTDRLLKRLAWLNSKTGKLWTVEELAKANTDRSLDARSRIAIAVAQLEAEKLVVTKSAVARRAKASRNTVVKNVDLLTLCSGEYIAGGVGGSLALPLYPDQLIFPDVASLSSTPFLFCPEASCFSSFAFGFLPVTVAPLFHAWQESLSHSLQYQDQALWVALQVLIPGPRLCGFQALRHATAGGILLSSFWLCSPGGLSGLSREVLIQIRHCKTFCALCSFCWFFNQFAKFKTARGPP